MDGKMLARLGAVVFVAITVTATAIDMARKDEPSVPPAAPILQPPADPLREGQRRCQQLGEAAASDAECLRVWAETRDRFLGRTHQPAAPRSSEER
jgi:conjugative transfer region protein TrbK